jgi:hypothetical protein
MGLVMLRFLPPFSSWSLVLAYPPMRGWYGLEGGGTGFAAGDVPFHHDSAGLGAGGAEEEV